MAFVSIIRKLSTSLVRMVLSLLLILMLFLHFWNLTPVGYIGTVMDDVFEHASTASKQPFTQKLLSVCDAAGGGSMADALLGKAEEAMGKELEVGEELPSEAMDLMIDVCTKEETVAEVREECDWLKSFPAATTLRMDSRFGDVDELEGACDAIETGQLEEMCEPLQAFGSGGQMFEVLETLEEGCSEYNRQGGDAGDAAAKAMIVGIAAATIGGDMGSIGDLLPEDVEDPSAKQALSILETALTVFSKLKESLVIHIGAILLVIGVVVLINIRHLDYAIKKVSLSMMGPSISIVLPYAAIQLYLTFTEVDTSPFFLALEGMTGFGQNMGGLLTSILPYLILRTYTMSLIIATVALAVIGLFIRIVGLAVLKIARKEKKEEKKEKKAKEKEKPKGKKPAEEKKGEKEEKGKEKKPEEKKGLFSKVLPKRKKPEEKKEKPAEEKKEEKPKEEPETPKPKEEKKPKEVPKVPKPLEMPKEKPKEKGKPDEKSPKEEKKEEPKKAK